MDVLWWILIAVAWIAIAFWPKTGHNLFGYSVFSRFFCPAAIIVAHAASEVGT